MTMNVREPTLALAASEPVAQRSGFWAGYWKTLKPLAVEEPIDVWVHRPIAYVLSKLLYPTAVSPNLVTFISILFGLAAGIAFFLSFPGHMVVAGACIFWSAVFDCADGQLARMRGTSSAFGRMLDGAADLVVAGAAVAGATYWLGAKYSHTPWLAAVVVSLAIVTIVTGSFHTGMYDHFKNVYLRLTSPGYTEGEDVVDALERKRASSTQGNLLVRAAWPIYIFYLKSQLDYIHRFDPFTSARLGLFPSYDPERAAIYERHAGRAMRVWRTWFGFGSLVFGIALFAAVDLLELYLAFRLFALNSVFYGYLRPAQRRASREAFREMGLRLPDQQAA
jgi:phosphatidylglycerophosphate synthase